MCIILLIKKIITCSFALPPDGPLLLLVGVHSLSLVSILAVIPGGLRVHSRDTRSWGCKQLDAVLQNRAL